MVFATLNVQKTGMITLPKKWRDSHPATILIAEETSRGLLIRPLEEVEYYEEPDGSFGLHFPQPMDMGRFLTMYKKALKKVEESERRQKRRRSPRK